MKAGSPYPSSSEKGREAEQPDTRAAADREQWLADRLAQAGADVYAGGPFVDFAERQGLAIVRAGIGQVRVSRGRNRETFRELWERIYGRRLDDLQEPLKRGST